MALPVDSPAPRVAARMERQARMSKANAKAQNVIPLTSEGNDLQAELARLRAENEKLKARVASAGKLALKVSEKGAVSVYGLGRFPVTLYQEQWLKLLGEGEVVKNFIKEHAAELKVKGDAKTGEA